jgi:hypothetical protein
MSHLAFMVEFRSVALGHSNFGLLQPNYVASVIQMVMVQLRLHTKATSGKILRSFGGNDKKKPIVISKE